MAAERLSGQLGRWAGWARRGAHAFDAGAGVRAWAVGAELPAAETRALVAAIFARAAPLLGGTRPAVHVVALPHVRPIGGERTKLRAALRTRAGRRWGLVLIEPDDHWRERLAHGLASVLVAALAPPAMEQASRAALVLRIAGLGVSMTGGVPS